jgi:hypothetical protein
VADEPVVDDPLEQGLGIAYRELGRSRRVDVASEARELRSVGPGLVAGRAVRCSA